MFLGPKSFFNRKYAISLSQLLVLRRAHKIVTIPLVLVQFKRGDDIGNFAIRLMKLKIFKISKIRQRVIDTLIRRTKATAYN